MAKGRRMTTGVERTARSGGRWGGQDRRGARRIGRVGRAWAARRGWGGRATPRSVAGRLATGKRLAALGALALVLAAAAAPAEAQQYGGALAVSGEQVLIGESGNVTLPGIVYVYGQEDGGWRETARLMASPAVASPDQFGRALAADGGLVVVGSPGWDGGRGAAMLFEMGAGGWSEIGRLAPEGRGVESAESGFGSAVAVSEGVILVSAPGEDDGAGALYVFVRGPDGRWGQRSRVVQPREDGEEERVAFGAVVAVRGAAALVATRAVGGRREEPLRPARVYAFSVDAGTGQLAFEAELEAPGGLGERPGFGASLAVSGGEAVVGAPGAGIVLRFRRNAETGEWAPSGRLVGFDLAEGERARFGAAVALEGSEAWVGAPGGRSDSGAVYRFAKDESGAWALSVRVDEPGLSERAAFGAAVAVAGDVAVVGAGGVDSRAGGAVALSRGWGDDWTGGGLLVGDHRSPPAILGLDEEMPCEENMVGHFPCDNVAVLSFLPIKDMGGARGARLNDVWGWTDPESGREIAIVGRTDGAAFVDLTDPRNPVMLGDLPKTPGSQSSVWRDMKVFRDHVYVVADGAGEHGVQVFDLRRLREEAGPDVVFEPDFTYDGIHSAHNIVLNEQTGFAYVVGSSGGGTTCGGGLHMLALDDPGRPDFAGCFFDTSTGRRRTGYSHDAQCVVYHGPDVEHQGKELCFGSNETRLSVADVTDKDDPKAIAAADYPNSAYAHQGWLTDDHRFFYMNDEGDEPQGLVEGTRTLIWDLADLDTPVLAAEYIAETPDTDHNLYILGDLMYQSNYGAGLRILDISNRTEPVEIAYFDNSPYGSGASWSNYPYFESGVVVVTSTGDGLFIVRNTARRNLIP